MSIDRHMENRAWAFASLDDLTEFVGDEDFKGNPEEERQAIETKRRELKEGKYRVVLLGAFNVGKSTMINAFLGDEYLPTILEECTTKITHVSLGEDMRIVLRMLHAPDDAELQALRGVMADFGLEADIAHNAEEGDLLIAFPSPRPKATLQTLRALTTMYADEDFPELKSLRGKFEELFVRLPGVDLEEDVALVDSPGVHSISETHSRIAHDVIPNSHLVLCLLDSHNAGNEQSRGFIESIIKHRHRKMFFVINKADHLNEEEIDPLCRRGPAKDLMRTLEGVVQSPELFFVSSLLAVVSQQLHHERLTLDALEHNNKVKIPFGVYRELLEHEQPTQRIAEYLLEKSRFTPLRRRLLDYLYSENREGAIVESVCQFVERKAWQYARALEVKLELARDIPRLAELTRQRESLRAELDEKQRRAEEILQDFDAMTGGGQRNGVEYPGYKGIVARYLDDPAIDKGLRAPLHAWADDPARFKDAQRNRWAPLKTDLEQRIDQRIAEAAGAANEAVRQTEETIVERAATVAPGIELGDAKPIALSRASVGPVQAGLGWSVLGFMAGGAAAVGAVGAAVALLAFDDPALVNALAQLQGALQERGVTAPILQEPTPQEAAVIGGAAGAAGGLALGLLARLFTAKGVRRRKMRRFIDETLQRILVKSEGEQTPATRDQLLDALEARRVAFKTGYKRAVENEVKAVKDALAAVEEEESQLRAEQRAIIERLEPKVERLSAMTHTAHAIVEAKPPA